MYVCAYARVNHSTLVCEDAQKDLVHNGKRVSEFFLLEKEKKRERHTHRDAERESPTAVVRRAGARRSSEARSG